METPHPPSENIGVAISPTPQIDANGPRKIYKFFLRYKRRIFVGSLP